MGFTLVRTVTGRQFLYAGVTEQDVFVMNLVHAAIPKEATCKAANAGSLQTSRMASAQKKLQEIQVRRCSFEAVRATSA